MNNIYVENNIATGILKKHAPERDYPKKVKKCLIAITTQSGNKSAIWVFKTPECYVGTQTTIDVPSVTKWLQRIEIGRDWGREKIVKIEELGGPGVPMMAHGRIVGDTPGYFRRAFDHAKSIGL